VPSYCKWAIHTIGRCTATLVCCVDATEEDGGPTPSELVQLVDQCDLSSSRNTTPSVSPSPQLSALACSGGTPQALRRRFLADFAGSSASAVPLQSSLSASFTPISARQSSATASSVSSSTDTLSLSPRDGATVSRTDGHIH